MTHKELIEAYETALNVIANAATTCEWWAVDSRDGGWSTHQVDENRKLATELRAFIAQARRVPKFAKIDVARLSMWVIYRSPSDFPGKYVVRRWSSIGGDGCGTIASSSPTAVVDSLEEARRAVPRGTFNAGRYMQDDPAIAEVWL